MCTDVQSDSQAKNPQCTHIHRENKKCFLFRQTILKETIETDKHRNKPLHLCQDEWQVGSHVYSGAKLPAKWQVTDHSVYSGTGHRQYCTHRGGQTSLEVI